MATLGGYDGAVGTAFTDSDAGGIAEAVYAASPDGVLVVDADGQIVMANPQAAELFATTIENLVGGRVERLIPAPLREEHVENRRRFSEAPRRRSMGAGLDLVAERSDGSTFPVDIALSPLVVDDTPYVVASVRDISERRFAEQELRITRNRLSRMEDRERIARDLHDTVIQEVFGAGLSLQAVMARVDDETAQQRITETIERLDGSIAKLREVIFDLRVIPEGPVRAALDDVLQAAAAELGFAPRLQLVGDPDAIDDEAIPHLLQTLREALTNVAKHASARSVDVSLAVGDHITLTVTDSGVGIADDAGGGYGMINMAERAEKLGGELVVNGRQEQGTRLIWRVPMGAR